jgi:hypothetical protein
MVVREKRRRNYTFNKKQTMYSLSAGQFAAGEYSYEAKGIMVYPGFKP